MSVLLSFRIYYRFAVDCFALFVVRLHSFPSSLSACLWLLIKHFFTIQFVQVKRLYLSVVIKGCLGSSYTVLSQVYCTLLVFFMISFGFRHQFIWRCGSRYRSLLLKCGKGVSVQGDLKWRGKDKNIYWRFNTFDCVWLSSIRFPLDVSEMFFKIIRENIEMNRISQTVLMFTCNTIVCL